VRSGVPAGVEFIRIFRTSIALLSVLLFVLIFPRQSFAQDDGSHWGVSVSAAPEWTITKSVRDLLADEGDVINMKGSEFTVGFVRGSTLGGDWGVSYVRKPFKDGLGLSSTSTDCFSPGPNQAQICLTDNEQNFFDKVMLNGVEVHWFIAPGFARIKNRVQIGANVGGGVAKFSGTIRKVEDRQEPVFTPGPGGGTVRVVTNHTEETEKAEDELLPIFPLLKVELEGAVIVTPAIKIKIAGGLNFPGSGIRVLGVYLFGAR